MYESYYRLSGKPFQLNPDPDFFYGSRGHRRAMAYLEYGLHQGEGFIVITGEVGAGKTTLVRNLLRRVPADSVVAAQIVSTQVSAEDLLRLVAGNFQIDGKGMDKSTLLLQLENHFRSMHADGKRVLLVVDEAQNLAPRAVEELRMLSNFQIGTRSMVQSFLVAQPEFRGILQRPEMRQMKQRIMASYHLGPLDPPETQAYIEHRMRHVGWRQDPLFTPEAFTRIHAITDGVPRRINTLCDRILLSGFLSETHRIEPELVDEVAAELAQELGSAETGGPQIAMLGGGDDDAPARQQAHGMNGSGMHHASAFDPRASAGALAQAVDALGELARNGELPLPGDPGTFIAEQQAHGEATSLNARIELLEARLALLETTATSTFQVLQRLLRAGSAAARKPAADGASTTTVGD